MNGRTIFIYVLLAISAVIIYPTIGWMTLNQEQRDSRLAKWREDDRASQGRTLSGDFLRKVTRWAQFDRDQVINLGLDLQGGVHIVVGFDPESPVVKEAMTARELSSDQVQDMIRQRIENRVNEFEAQEPLIQNLGTSQVQIQLPGEKDTQRATNLIMKTAFLTFHMTAGPTERDQVLREAHNYFSKDGRSFVPFLDAPMGSEGPYAVSSDNFERVKEMVDEANATEGALPVDKLLAFSTPPKAVDTAQTYHLYVLDREAEMTGEGLKTAVARPDSSNPGRWQIIFEFGSEGAGKFADVTQANIGRNMAIVLDGNVVSAPRIDDRIFGTGNITGSFTREESTDLAIALNSGSMPVPIRLDYQGVVGATLGSDSVRKGVVSSIVGLLAVVAFMIVYYRFAGLVANIGLVFGALLMMAAMAYFNATLTLPGIAGFILTIGMAVDANVLIYERFREEIRRGKGVVSAIDSGYANAFSAILDTHVTTLISALVLGQFGTGPIQGFAIALSIGVCASLFSALVVTRAVFDFLTKRKMLSNLSMMSFVPHGFYVSFMNYRWKAATFSIVSILIGMGWFAYRGQDNFGVDFTNGTNMMVSLNSDVKVPVGELRDRLDAAGFTAPSVQESSDSAAKANQFVIRVGETGTLTNDKGEEVPVARRVQEALQPLSGHPESGSLDDQVTMLKIEAVGPAVGRQLQRDALAAVLYAILFIVVYIWFRFDLKYAVGGIVALFHDVFFTVGVFALLGREVTLPVVAAVLTVIGYSLNDTIVVYDRVREELRLQRGKGKTFMQILDLSVSETLSRTILTSLTVMITVVVLYFFGGSAINDFALVMIIGVLIGTYSSIYVANPTIYWWQYWLDRRRDARTNRDRRDEPKGGGESKKKKKRPKDAEAAPA